MMRCDSLTYQEVKKMLFGSIWLYALSSDHLTLVPPCCTRRRAQFECCRYPQRSSSSILITFFTIGSLSLMSRQFQLSHQRPSPPSSHLNGLPSPPPPSSWGPSQEKLFLKMQNRRKFFAFHRKWPIKLFLVWHTFSQCVLFLIRVSAFPNGERTNPRFCGCTISHNLRCLLFSGLLGNCGNVSWMQSFSFGFCATSPLFRDCRISIWHWLPHCGKCVRPPLQIFSILAKRVSKFQSKVGEAI